MKTSDDSIVLKALDRFCQSTSDALALIDESGKLVSLNGPMQATLRRHAAPETLLEDFCRTGKIDTRHLKSGAVAGGGLNLVKLTLGQLRLITCIERPDDHRIQRLQQKLEQAEKLSITDRLTGAWNRQHFDDVVGREIMRSQRYGEPLCLALIDIDHFKQVNDEHGHAAGDQVLTEMVELIQSRIRMVDSLFRWGGEEFAVLLPHSPLNGARMSAERLRAATEHHPFSSAGQLTVSIGVAELGSAESGQDWFQRTDRALYQAKREGRNRVICSAQEHAAAVSEEQRDAVVFLPWKASYECGHALIDSQHQQLFVLGNRLIAASLDTQTNRDDFLATVDELIAHVGQHFSDEEGILAALGYAELPSHRRAHSALLGKVNSLRDKAVNGTATSSEVIDFLVNGVVKNHMLTADKAFFGQLAPEREPAMES